MLVKGISRADLEAAVEIASGTLGNRLELYAIYPANRRTRSAWRFRVKVADPDAPGARRYFRRYRLGLTKAPKRSHNPCAHALGALCVAIFERKPYARVETFHPAFFGGSSSGMRGSSLENTRAWWIGSGEVFVRDRRNRYRDDRRLWGDLRRPRP
jgi:hypothetical protein